MIKSNDNIDKGGGLSSSRAMLNRTTVSEMLGFRKCLRLIGEDYKM